jgi:hypothetical protein
LDFILSFIGKVTRVTVVEPIFAIVIKEIKGSSGLIMTKRVLVIGDSVMVGRMKGMKGMIGVII